MVPAGEVPGRAKEHVGYSKEMNSVVLELLKASLLTLGALFPIVNPLGNAPIFLSLTRGYSSETRGWLARRVAIDRKSVV